MAVVIHFLTSNHFLLSTIHLVLCGKLLSNSYKWQKDKRGHKGKGGGTNVLKDKRDLLCLSLCWKWTENNGPLVVLSVEHHTNYVVDPFSLTRVAFSTLNIYSHTILVRNKTRIQTTTYFRISCWNWRKVGKVFLSNIYICIERIFYTLLDAWSF